ncbi:hypothetical protein B0H16DRAFT_1884395 [Mycena metata]|uniref:MYND-type domain-containing protein n=1 Tax=Mycena metata TaxID=1033252 RepID=A0AAD7JCY2_9AGAR|nr:hypothetical protein B0H16DRAFT_1884395 [Mycena metata]
MDLKCDNLDCPGASASPGVALQTLLVCSGCSAVHYCSKECQKACWKAHKQACRMHPASLAGLRLRVVPEVEDYYLDEESDDGENEYSAQKIIDLKIEKTTAKETIEVGTIKIQVIDIPMTNRNGGFFECVDEYSHELGKLALNFNARGRLRPNQGCWQPQDFRNNRYLVYLEELIIDPAWRGKGLGTWALPKLFDLEALHGSQYIFAWPTVLGNLDEQAAWTIKRDRIIRFFQKAGFRRLINSDFFCVAKNASHRSRAIPIEEDAPFKELPPPTTEEEAMRRFMANN